MIECMFMFVGTENSLIWYKYDVFVEENGMQHGQIFRIYSKVP